jgi:hypothetical protein
MTDYSDWSNDESLIKYGFVAMRLVYADKPITFLRDDFHMIKTEILSRMDANTNEDIDEDTIGELMPIEDWQTISSEARHRLNVYIDNNERFRADVVLNTKLPNDHISRLHDRLIEFLDDISTNIDCSPMKRENAQNLLADMQKMRGK